jgi:hypothetical protein
MHGRLLRGTSSLIASRRELQMKIEKILSVTKFNPNEKAVDTTKHLTPDARISMVEDLREEMAKVTHNEYPQRLRRILEIAKR